MTVVHLLHPDGTVVPARYTSWAPLADALETVATQGEAAVLAWCEAGEDRPAVDDATTDPWTGAVTLDLVDTLAVVRAAEAWWASQPGRSA